MCKSFSREIINLGAGVQWVAYSGDGSAQGEVVYCHHGRLEDFERLDRLGITVKVR